MDMDTDTAPIHPLSTATPSEFACGSHALSTIPSSVDGNTIQFTTVDKLLQDIKSVSGDALCVSGVSADDFAIIVKPDRRGFRVKRFYSDQKLLIITIPTTIHELLHAVIYTKFVVKLALMGVEDEWQPHGATTYRSTHPNGDGGEGDSTGGPRFQRLEPGAWPTLVIEVGYSQSLAALRVGMEWWFRTSNHQVKIVILAHWDSAQRRITLEKYQEAPAAQRTGATSTRAASTPRPRLEQVIHIIRTSNNANIMDPMSFEVIREQLRLDFGLLFLRQPGPGEHDIVLGIPDLQNYASRVWQDVRP